MKNMKNRRRQGGFALMEMLVALAVMLILVALALGMSTVTRSSSKSLDTQQQVTLVSEATQMLGRSGYTGITEAVVANSGRLPESWLTGPAAARTGIRNSERGTFTIAAADVNGGTANGALITVSGLSRSTCNTVLTNSQSNYVEIGTSVTANLKAYGDEALTSDAIVTACNKESVDLLLTVI